MLMDVDDVAPDEIESAIIAEIESLSAQLVTASPSGVEAIAEQIGAQVARLRAARAPAPPAAPVADEPAVPDPSAPVGA